VNSDWIISTENARHGNRETRAKYTLAPTPWDWMSVMYSMLHLTEFILVEVASLEAECNGHFTSDPPRPLCCGDRGEIHCPHSQAESKKVVQLKVIDGESRKILNRLVFLGFSLRHGSEALVTSNFGIICKL
jgi:hypothetical protein